MGCFGIRNGHETPRLVVDAAPTIPANSPACLEVGDGAITLNDRPLLMAPLNGALGTGVTKTSRRAWAETSGTLVAMARKRDQETAVRENRQRICALQRRCFANRIQQLPELDNLWCEREQAPNGGIPTHRSAIDIKKEYDVVVEAVVKLDLIQTSAAKPGTRSLP